MELFGEHDRLQRTFFAGLRCSHRTRHCVADQACGADEYISLDEIQKFILFYDEDVEDAMDLEGEPEDGQKLGSHAALQQL